MGSINTTGRTKKVPSIMIRNVELKSNFSKVDYTGASSTLPDKALPYNKEQLKLRPYLSRY
jgi:hypothetical protein